MNIPVYFINQKKLPSDAKYGAYYYWPDCFDNILDKQQIIDIVNDDNCLLSPAGLSRGMLNSHGYCSDCFGYLTMDDNDVDEIYSNGINILKMVTGAVCIWGQKIYTNTDGLDRINEYKVLQLISNHVNDMYIDFVDRLITDRLIIEYNSRMNSLMKHLIDIRYINTWWFDVTIDDTLILQFVKNGQLFKIRLSELKDIQPNLIPH